MSSILSILLCMFVCVSIVLVAIWINRTLNHQVNMIIEIAHAQKESFDQSTAAGLMNNAASFVGQTNHLLPTSQNAVYNKDATPGFVPDSGNPRAGPFNDIAGSKNQSHVKDANNVAGELPSAQLGSALKESQAIPRGEANTTGKTARAENTENNKIQVSGADIKADKVTYEDGSSVVTQKANIPSSEAVEDKTFSPYGRVNASSAASLVTPTQGQIQNQIQETFRKTYKKVGKI